MQHTCKFGEFTLYRCHLHGAAISPSVIPACLSLIVGRADNSSVCLSVCLSVCTKSVSGRAIEAGRPSSFRGGEGHRTLSALPPIVIGASCPLAVYNKLWRRVAKLFAIKRKKAETLNTNHLKFLGRQRSAIITMQQWPIVISYRYSLYYSFYSSIGYWVNAIYTSPHYTVQHNSMAIRLRTIYSLLLSLRPRQLVGVGQSALMPCMHGHRTNALASSAVAAARFIRFPFNRACMRSVQCMHSRTCFRRCHVVFLMTRRDAPCGCCIRTAYVRLFDAILLWAEFWRMYIYRTSLVIVATDVKPCTVNTVSHPSLPGSRSTDSVSASSSIKCLYISSVPYSVTFRLLDTPSTRDRQIIYWQGAGSTNYYWR